MQANFVDEGEYCKVILDLKYAGQTIRMLDNYIYFAIVNGNGEAYIMSNIFRNFKDNLCIGEEKIEFRKGDFL